MYILHTVRMYVVHMQQKHLGVRTYVCGIFWQQYHIQKVLYTYIHT